MFDPLMARFVANRLMEWARKHQQEGEASRGSAVEGVEAILRRPAAATTPAAAASALARHGAAARRAKVLRVMNKLRAEMGMAPYQP
jgi:hypothetical protein